MKVNTLFLKAQCIIIHHSTICKVLCHFLYFSRQHHISHVPKEGTDWKQGAFIPWASKFLLEIHDCLWLMHAIIRLLHTSSGPAVPSQSWAFFLVTRRAPQWLSCQWCVKVAILIPAVFHSVLSLLNGWFLGGIIFMTNIIPGLIR